MNSSQPGPSRPSRQPTPDLLGSSPEFGDFESAHGAHTAASVAHHYNHHSADRHSTRRPPIDLLSDEPLQDDSWPPSTTRPIHINLPPRPSEISPDYEPPLRSPHRLSRLSFPGPGSPPQLSDVVFHPTHVSETDHPRSRTAQSKLFNTLATTTKIASKWRSALDHHTFSPPTSATTSHPPSDTALPINVNHSTPFNIVDRFDNVYIPPSGAPSYVPEPLDLRHNGGDETYTGTLLVGRREATAPVLNVKLADSIRPHLPPRQRLSPRWTLLFSLDQHGASLATLYRLVDTYAVNHRAAGSVIVVKDGRNNVFGSYINEPINRREGQYYGGGDSFLFKAQDGEARLFRWTGKNQYFALCEGDLISFGGGAGTYGLILDATFTRNSSSTCPTFDNEILCDVRPTRSETAVPFECLGLEVWGTQ